MKGVLAVLRKELRTAANTAPAYVFAVFFLVFTSAWLFFVRGFFALGEASLRPYFEIMPAVFSVLVPALTMRSWAEERRTGTFELLRTLPLSPAQIVLGKYLGVLAVIALTLLASAFVPLSLAGFGDFDPGVLGTEYLGALAMASACAAVGQMVSSRVRSQVSAFLLSSAALLVLSLAGSISARTRLPAPAADALSWMSLDAHFESFVRGVLDSRDLGYFVLVTAFFLYLTAKGLSKAAWK